MSLFLKLFSVWVLTCGFAVSAAELSKTREMFFEGDYKQVIKDAEEAIKENEYQEEWRQLLAESLFIQGKYADSLTVLSNALDRYTSSVQLRLLGFDVYRHNNQPERAEELLREINQLARFRMWAFRDPANMVALGRAAILLRTDPKLVLDRLYEPAKKINPNHPASYLAAGEIALQKNDYDLAAKQFNEGVAKFPKRAEFHYGMARAFYPSDRGVMLKAIDAALDANKNHLPSLLLLAEHQIDSEDLKEAEKTIKRILEVNPWHPEAWAYEAVIRHLQANKQDEAVARSTSLKYWKTNPVPDHLIGKKLSQKYRFAEGAMHQRKALELDPFYLPAKIQLAQDLLRLGHDEGWQLAQEAYEDDAYDVTTFNLLNLKDTLNKYSTLTNEHFIIRLHSAEAKVFGPRVMALLERAREKLLSKYEVTLEEKTTVEIFSDQKDFGVRTFGMPDNPGFLGVCFGNVITANSPSTQAASPANWEAVLWHEFCHVVTLNATRNKMPRWLSEGISVYEEIQENRTWGQSMKPRYREMILEGDLTPVSELSGAFLAPKTPEHLQFAYYESSLVVDYLISNYGISAIKKILGELREGIEINVALSKHAAPIEDLDSAFEKWATEKAKAFGPDLDWTKSRPLFGEGEEPEIEKPNSYYQLLSKARREISAKNWEASLKPLEQITKSYPVNADDETPFILLARAYRELGRTNDEHRILTQIATYSEDAKDVYAQLVRLEWEAGNWKAVAENAQRMLAVNPFLKEAHRAAAESAEKLSQTTEAIAAYEALLFLDDDDPAETHFRLARLKQQDDKVAAKMHLLKSLEETPRYKEALAEFLKLRSEVPQ